MPFQADLKICVLLATSLSKKAGEVEQPEKAKEQREHYGNDCVQPVRTDQKFRSGC